MVGFNLREKFNSKLLDINSEFTSLEESGLIEFINSLASSSSSSSSSSPTSTTIMFRLAKLQQEFTQLVLNIIDELKYSKDFEKLNRLILAIMNNIEIVNIILFNSNLSLLYKLIDIIDSSNFTTDDNGNGNDNNNGNDNDNNNDNNNDNDNDDDDDNVGLKIPRLLFLLW